MTHEYIEERNGGYYIAGTRISLDSVVYAFERGSSPEAIHNSFPALKPAQIYGAIAFYLDYQEMLREYLASEDRRIDEVSTPLNEVNPDLWERLQRAKDQLRKAGS
ncbi:MAG TPA: DUF433 domain-containing protein [Verrucomicrobiae bacterium]|nr:DUF433 domain-containing protein [Verrucomicrobiae bacterium]